MMMQSFCKLEYDQVFGKEDKSLSFLNYSSLYYHQSELANLFFDLEEDFLPSGFTIIRNVEPEDAGTIIINAKVIGYNSTFTASSFVEAFIDDDNDECRSKEDLNYFLMESGINDDDTADSISKLILYVDEVTSSASSNYSPGYGLLVSLLLIPNNQIEEEVQIEEAVRVSFDETNNIPLRPASKLVVKSLTKKIYEKISSTGETCTICLEEFNDERRVVTLPCGHDFDDECVLTWFETNHACPLCRFKLPCEDQY